MHPRTFATLACGLLLAQTCSPAAAGQLVSIKNMEPRPGVYVWGFDIEIEQAKVSAICWIPDGWSITATNYAETALYKGVGAHISAEANVGHVAFDAGSIKQLLDLFLIEPASSKSAAKLDGSIRLEGYDE